jgi:MoxR-like ATPase
MTDNMGTVSSPKYLSNETIANAIADLRGTANHLMKIWFVLKAMGMDSDNPVTIDTSNSTPALQRLFSCGAPNGDFYIPFSHTSRFAFMKSDASRSIIQTNIQRWVTSASVVTCDPRSYLDIRNNPETGELTVRPGRQYPMGLGYGANGFALEENSRTTIPDLQFAVWLYAQEDIGRFEQPNELITKMMELLHLDIPELNTVFVQKPIELTFQDEPISDDQLYELCKSAFDESVTVEEVIEERSNYIKRVQNMATITDIPRWMQTDPEKQLADLVSSGEKAILLYGPPRTGKTRAIDKIRARTAPDRTTIQLHEGWGYENLIIGLYPLEDPGKFDWKEGLLLANIRLGKTHIVLEEINRTHISQALGESFSLIENGYRGEDNAILLPDGSLMWIPDNVVFYFTMNTVDSSTEDIDDALIGRMASVYFPPRIESLDQILIAKSIPSEQAEKIKEVFNIIQASYPLGHGYFAGFQPEQDFRLFYLSRVRPVLANHFDSYKPEVLNQIDNSVDALFASEA